MITAGIDVGLAYIKAVILKDGTVVGKASGLSGGAKRPAAVEAVYAQALREAGIDAADVTRVFATGKGKFDVPFAARRVAESAAAAGAARLLVPGATTVADIGADEIVVATLTDTGIQESLINQKCSAGLGLFLEYMARRMELSMEEMGKAVGPGEVSVNDGCPVFAELDALSLLNRGVDRCEVAKAITEACAWRASSVLNDIYRSALDCVVLLGGVAKNGAFVRALERICGIRFEVPDDPEFAGAIGAAALAAA